ncbi:MAG: hypothetical protein R3Y63_11240 [Eubacteriales bacterium]
MTLHQCECKIQNLEEENAALRLQIQVMAKHFGKTLEKLEETDTFYREYEEISHRSYKEKDVLQRKITALEEECDRLRENQKNPF